MNTPTTQSYVCKKCDRGFSHPQGLRMHIQRAHGPLRGYQGGGAKVKMGRPPGVKDSKPRVAWNKGKVVGPYGPRKKADDQAALQAKWRKNKLQQRRRQQEHTNGALAPVMFCPRCGHFVNNAPKCDRCTLPLEPVRVALNLELLP